MDGMMRMDELRYMVLMRKIDALVEGVEALKRDVLSLRRSLPEVKSEAPAAPEPAIRFTAEVLEDGRITVPSAVRKKYNIEKGDLLELGLIQIIKTKGRQKRSGVGVR